MISKKIPNNLSRRNWLRGVAITATGAAVLPSFLTGCSNDSEDNGGLGSLPPLGSAPLTHDELEAAALNLIRMNDWISDVYTYTGGYEKWVRDTLLAGEKPKDWKDFTLSIISQLGVAILQAAIKAAEATFGPFVGPVVAIVDATIKQFAFGSAPQNLLDAFADFEKTHLEMQKAISDQLLYLAKPGTDKTYQALQDAFKDGDLEFNGKKYSLRDLVNAKFPYIDRTDPDKGSPYEYGLLRTAAYDQFKIHIWNVLIMKAGHIDWHYWGNVTPYDIDQWGGCVRDWALGRFYANEPYAGGYLRGYHRDGFFEGYTMEYWRLDFDGKPISAATAKELFIDDIRGRIMHPDPDNPTKPKTGLFPRDYVFKQFNTSKTDFGDYYDLVEYSKLGCRGRLVFDESSLDYEYKGGDFPELIK